MKHLLLSASIFYISLTFLSCTNNQFVLNQSNPTIKLGNFDNKIKLSLKTISGNTFNAKGFGSDGEDNKTISDLSTLKLILSNNCTDSNTAFNNPVNSGEVNISNTLFNGSNIEMFFEGLADGSYCIAAKAYDSNNKNITKNGIYFTQPGTNETISIGSGIISINNDTITIPPDTWNISIPLLDAKGANIDSEINAENGDLGDFKTNEIKANNQQFSGNQINPDLFIDDLGNGFMVFEDQNQSPSKIYGKYINGGFPSASEVEFNSANPASEPKIYLTESSGNGYVSWLEVNSNNQLMAYRINNYKVDTSSSAIEIKNAFANSIFSPSLVISPDITGKRIALFVWSESDNIFAKAISSDNQFNSDPSGGSFSSELNVLSGSVSTVSEINQNGDALVISSGNNDIILQKINITLGAVSPFTPNITNQGSQQMISLGSASVSNISVSINNQGNGVIVFEANGDSTDVLGLKIQNFQAIGLPFDIASGNKTSPDVKINDNGEGIVLFSDYDGSINYSIKGLKIENSNIVGNQSLGSSNDNKSRLFPKVFINSKGNGTALWQTEETSGGGVNDIFSRRIVDFRPQ